MTQTRGTRGTIRSCRCLKEAKLSVFRLHAHVFKPEMGREGHERDIEIAGCTGGRRAGPGRGRGLRGPGGASQVPAVATCW